MAVQEYLNFDLCIERTAHGYQAEVTNSPAGEASIRFALPFSDLELENFILRVGGRRRMVRGAASAQVEAAQAFGGRLFQAIFDNEVRGCLHSSMLEAAQQGKGLRVRLRLDDAPELVDLPWEYLYNPDRGLFLSLSAKTPVVRYIDLPQPPDALTITAPLRILVVVSSPNDYEPLDVEREWTNLNSALTELLQQGLVTLERMEEATLPALQRKLRERPFHILHFIGHGVFDERSQDGTLIFEDAQGKGAEVSGHYLGTLLHDHNSLRLVVLNACEGARSSTIDPFAGMAQSIVRQGIPAVIAMQFEISDVAAITFAHEFYGAIADQYPVDAALAEARKAIFAQGIGVEWGTPVLYLRAANGRIFDVMASATRESAAPFSLPAAAVDSAPSAPPVAVPVVTQPNVQTVGAAHATNAIPAVRRRLPINMTRLLSIIGALTVIATICVGAIFIFVPLTLECQVNSPGLNLRSGPGTVYQPPLGTLASGERLTAHGRTSDSQWLLVETVATARRGWVSGRSSLVGCSGDVATLPLAEIPPTPTASVAASAIANADTTTAASPASSLVPGTVEQVLDAPMPRSVCFNDLVFTVTHVQISDQPPAISGFNLSSVGGRAYASINLSLFNPLAQKTLLVNPGQVKLQLSDGIIYEELSHWSGAIMPDRTQAAVLFYEVPESATWEGAKLLIRVPGKEPALLALDGPAPVPQFPVRLAQGTSATVEQVSYEVLDATLDLDSNGERANLGERFLTLTLQVLNENATSGNLLLSSDTFRLRVGDTPLAPVTAPSEILPQRSAKRVQVVFVVPATEQHVELQVGQLSGATASIQVSLDANVPAPSQR